MKYYYGNSYKEAISNPPVTIRGVKQLRGYEENYSFVIPADEIDSGSHETIELWEVAWKRPDRNWEEQYTPFHEYNYERAKEIYTNMAQGGEGTLEYVVFRKVTTDCKKYRKIEILARAENVLGRGK